MNSGSNGWFIALADGQARGPYERTQLIALRAAGQLAEDALVWTLDSAEWVPVKRALPPSTVSQLQAVAALAPVVATVADGASSRTVGRVAPPPAKSEPRSPKSSTNKSVNDARPVPVPGTAAHAPPRAAAAPGVAAVDKAKVQLFAFGARRLLARNIDLLVLGGLGWALASRALLELGTYLPPFPQAFDRSFLVVALLALLVVPLEAVLLAISGYTPGKFALGIRVVGRGKGGVGIVRAFKRALDVLVRGQALLVPPFSLIAYGFGLHALVNKGRTRWDERLGTDVEHAPMSTNRWWTGLALLVLGYGALRDNLFTKLVWALVP